VPYNLFRLFLVHKISIYAFIYENRKKEKDFLANWAEGDFGPTGGARVATQAGGPARPASESGVGTTSWARADVLARGEKNVVRGVTGGGRPREKPAAGV
jgi:hypothetical protein